MEMNPANIAWRQIPVMTKMAVGAREASVSGEHGEILTFKVGRALTWIRVVYVAGLDTYKVELVKGRSAKVVESHEDVYAENLSETIYHAVCK